MASLEDILDLENLSRRIAEGYISDRRNGGLRLLNYTARAQYERVWDNETRKCRGLVTTEDGKIISRPFEKFFNVGEHESLPIEPFDVYEKLDGSLIVAATGPDGLSITSRGSFESDQAQAARRLWTSGITPPPGQTWCLELLAPWNRIVVDYGGDESLVLLAAIDNETGRDVPLPEAWEGRTAKVFPFSDMDEIMGRLSVLGPDEEGYVLRFRDSGLRVKAKGIEYLRLHRLVTGCTARAIWETLVSGENLDSLLDRVPDEFADWVRATAADLRREFAGIENEVTGKFNLVRSLPSRKEQAEAIAEFAHRAAVFRMLDGKSCSDLIWKSIYPPASSPFRCVSEAVA